MNVDPLPISQEINKEEKEHDRVAGDYASEKKISLLTVMEKKQKKIHALMQGQTIPFHAMFAIRVWDKSVTVCDLLSQTEGYFGYTVIIEEGLSYGIYTATVEPGARPIIIHPDGDLTINYLDTKGLPLTPDHLSAATALVARMIGTSSQEDKQMLRQAQIAKYLNLLYEDSFQDWQKKRHNQLLDITRHAMALQHFRAEKMPPGATTLETFADFRDWKAAHPTEAEEYQRQFEEAAVLKFLKDPRTSKEVRNLAFAHFSPDEFPTHRMLQELMMLDPIGSERDQIKEIATLILPWCRDGNYGCLFDGTSNLSLTGRIAHFELGYIPESAKELKAAAGFLITNHARKHIMTLPRALRKRNIYEEVARFLDIPGGQEIVQESYAQLRKFNCWNCAKVPTLSRASSPTQSANEPELMKKLLIQSMSLACFACLFTGCAALTRATTDVALGAGGAAIGGVLTKGNPLAIAGGGAGGVLLGEGLHYANGKLNSQSYQTGYDKGRSDAVKQQYWLYVGMQQAKTGDEGRVRLYEVHLPEQTIDGVIFKPTTQFLRIEQ